MKWLLLVSSIAVVCYCINHFCLPGLSHILPYVFLIISITTPGVGASRTKGAAIHQFGMKQQRRPLQRQRIKRNVTAYTKKRVAYEQTYRCQICKCVLPPDYEVDHRVPLQFGGSNHRDNLQALCKSCHSQKTMKESQSRFGRF